jgi:hypothetical protein
MNQLIYIHVFYNILKNYNECWEKIWWQIDEKKKSLNCDEINNISSEISLVEKNDYKKLVLINDSVKKYFIMIALFSKLLL